MNEDQALDPVTVQPARPLKGSRVRVIKGRKVPIGTTGEVIWYGETQYGHRVGIAPLPKAEDATGAPVQQEVVWTAADNVEVVIPAPEGAPEPMPYNPAASPRVRASATTTARVSPYAKRAKVTTKSIILDADGDYRIMFPYDPDLVAVVKSFFSRRTWNKDHGCWIVPGTLRGEVLTFAARRGFDLTEPSDHLAKLGLTPLPPPVDPAFHQARQARQEAAQAEVDRIIALEAADETAALVDKVIDAAVKAGTVEDVVTPDGEVIHVLDSFEFGR